MLEPGRLGGAAAEREQLVELGLQRREAVAR